MKLTHLVVAFCVVTSLVVTQVPGISKAAFGQQVPLIIQVLSYSKVGIDANDPGGTRDGLPIGPDRSIIHARVINTGGDILNGLTATFQWTDTTDEYVVLSPHESPTKVLGTLEPRERADAFWVIEVARDLDAIRTYRHYSISVASADTVISSVSKLLAVVGLTEEPQNHSAVVSAPTAVNVGETFCVETEGTVSTSCYHVAVPLQFDRQFFELQKVRVDYYESVDFSGGVSFSDDTLYYYRAREFPYKALRGYFTLRAVAAGTGRVGSLQVNANANQTSCRYASGLWAGSAEIIVGQSNQPPDQPSNVAPSDGATDMGLTPTLESSAFSDPDAGDTHGASQWQVSGTSGDYSAPVFDSGVDVGNLTQVTIPGGVLGWGTTYYWRVRHQDNHGEWSSWSVETCFTTTEAPNQPPDQPSNVAPSDGATDVGLTPTLESSAFSDPDAGDTHGASQWQVSGTSGDYSAPVFDSGVDVGNLTQVAIPGGVLGWGTTYYWRVRHQDDRGGWSAWSSETCFTTLHFGAPTLLSPPDGASLESDTVTYEWAPVTGAANYRLIVSTDARLWYEPGRKTVVDVGDVTSYEDTGYPWNGTEYYWWVFAQASDGSWSQYAEVNANGLSFLSATIEAPVLLSPGEGTTLDSDSVTYEWAPVTGATNYRLIVSADPRLWYEPSRKIVVDLGNVTSYEDTGYPWNGTEYYWWVFAQASDGSWSQYAEVNANGLSFLSATIEAPVLLSPGEGTALDSDSVTYEWAPVTGAANYRLIVSTDPRLWYGPSRKIVADLGNVTSYEDTGYPWNGAEYYWWVFAQAPDGSWSPYSDVDTNGRSFTTLSVGAPTLLSPGDGAAVAGDSVAYEWTAIAGATNYRLIVSTDPRLWYEPGRKAVIDVGDVTTHVDTGYPGDGTRYYWWVFAQASDGTWSSYSDVDANGHSLVNG